MSAFSSYRAYRTFAEYIRRTARHVFNTENQEFLRAVVSSSSDREFELEKHSVLWRAALDFSWCEQAFRDDEGTVVDSIDVEGPAEPSRMIPWVDKAKEGRVNVKGIPCLYLSTDRDTAMSEVRPWIRSYVSVAEFMTLRNLRFVNCSRTERAYWENPFNPKQPTGIQVEQSVWHDINEAFSEPVMPTDDRADYAPTQVLAEAFRSGGYDGVIYSSKLGCGKTFAVFDIKAADLIRCHLFRVKNLRYDFTEEANPYWEPKYWSEAFQYKRYVLPMTDDDA